MPKATIWVAYDNNGDIGVSNDSADDAISNYPNAEPEAAGMRVVELELDLPEIKPLKVSGTIPDKDGPVTITIS